MQIKLLQQWLIDVGLKSVGDRGV